MASVDLSELKRILKKILQAYRIRLKCMVKRRDALMKIATRFEYINDYPDIYKDLQYCLRYEKKLLDIISKEEKGAENQIVLALNILKSSIPNLEEAAQKDRSLKRQLKRDEIKVRGAIEICNAAVDFLEAADNDIKSIEKRMKLEEYFIEKPAEESFNKFIKEWQKELIANNTLLKHIKKIVKKVKHRNEMWIDYVKYSGAATGVMGATGAGIAHAALGRLDTTIAGAAIGASISFIAFVFSLYEYYKDVVEIEIEDKKLIERIMSSKGIKMHWWSKL